MSANQTEERKPLPSTEYSQKYMSWHLKDISTCLKSIDESMKAIAGAVLNKNVRAKNHQEENDDIPF